MNSVNKTILRLTQAEFDGIVDHLLPDLMEQEEVAFAFAELSGGDEESSLTLLEWTAVAPKGFRSRSRYHLDLTDETRVRAIMRAHELGCCLIEWHSHCGSWPAKFSPTDQMGFREFVPHVRWRLGRRPYAAVVVAKGSFDALAWIDNGFPRRLSIMLMDKGQWLEPTGLSSLGGEESYD